MACVNAECPCRFDMAGRCKSFAEWARNPVATVPKFGFEGWTPFLRLNDIRQAIFLKHLQQQSTDKNTSGLRRADIFGAITARSAVSEGETRLARFLAVLGRQCALVNSFGLCGDGALFPQICSGRRRGPTRNSASTKTFCTEWSEPSACSVAIPVS